MKKEKLGYPMETNVDYHKVVERTIDETAKPGEDERFYCVTVRGIYREKGHPLDGKEVFMNNYLSKTDARGKDVPVEDEDETELLETHCWYKNLPKNKKGRPSGNDPMDFSTTLWFPKK